MVLTTGFENQPCRGVLLRLKPVRELLRKEYAQLQLDQFTQRRQRRRQDLARARGHESDVVHNVPDNQK